MNRKCEIFDKIHFENVECKRNSNVITPVDQGRQGYKKTRLWGRVLRSTEGASKQA